MFCLSVRGVPDRHLGDRRRRGSGIGPARRSGTRGVPYPFGRRSIRPLRLRGPPSSPTRQTGTQELVVAASEELFGMAAAAFAALLSTSAPVVPESASSRQRASGASPRRNRGQRELGRARHRERGHPSRASPPRGAARTPTAVYRRLGRSIQMQIGVQGSVGRRRARTCVSSCQSAVSPREAARASRAARTSPARHRPSPRQAAAARSRTVVR